MPERRFHELGDEGIELGEVPRAGGKQQARACRLGGCWEIGISTPRLVPESSNDVH
jgi:hypothetical protein